MKAAIIQVVFMTLMGFLTTFADQGYNTTAKLPDNAPIWPTSKIGITEDAIGIKAQFVESKKLFSVTQGNLTTTTYLVKYKVIEKDGRYPYDELTFIALDGWPAKGSGIVVQKLPWPFVKGEKTFYLKKDNDCKYKAFFNILSYS